jgi:hypothetical protein
MLVYGLAALATLGITYLLNQPSLKEARTRAANEIVNSIKRKANAVTAAIANSLHSITREKDDAESGTKAASESQKQSNYWAAEVVGGVVTPLVPLTYSEARIWVSSGNNLLCKNHAAAFAIIKFYPSAVWDPAHGGKYGKENGYLNHYHLSSAHTNHIWYYGD